MEITKFIAIDTETQFKDGLYYPFIVTMTNSLLESKLFKIPEDREQIKLICESKDIVKIFHNAVYDIFALSLVEINVLPPVEDTMIMSNLINENYESKNLKKLAEIYLGESCNEVRELSKIASKFKKQFKKEGKIFDYSCIPVDILYPYAIKDSEYTIKLFFYYSNQIKKFIDVYKKEIDLIFVIVDMIKNGIKIDKKFVKEMVIYCKKKITESYNEMFNEIKSFGYIHEKDFNEYLKHRPDLKNKEINFLKKNYVFNPDSSVQLIKIAETLGVRIENYTEKGNPSFDMNTVKTINHPFMKALYKYRYYTKQLNTYYDPLIKKYALNRQRSHFLFYQTGAKSGRFSANLIQTIPRVESVSEEFDDRVVRKSFVPDENKYFLSMDYDQIEMRLFVHYSNNKKLIEAIKKGIDPHLQTAYYLFGEDKVNSSEENKKRFRKIAKNINFGMIYGMGKKLLAKSLGLDLFEAEEILKHYDNEFGISEFTKKLIGKLYRNGYISININSPLMKLYRIYRVPQEMAYKAVNILIQGTASYVMKYAMIRVWNYIKENKLNDKIKIILTIHDELLFEIDKSIPVNDAFIILYPLLEDRVTFKVPVEVSGKYSFKSWGEMKDIEIKNIKR